MFVLKVGRRVLHSGTDLSDPQLANALSETRKRLNNPVVFYSAIEEPSAFFVISEWASLAASLEFESRATTADVMRPLDQLSTVEWTEHMEIDGIATLPLAAPIMTVSRCFFKEYDSHPETYEKEVAALLGPIEQETKPWRYVGGWTVDTTKEKHKWLVFGGYRSKKHHQELATRLKQECDFFESMPEHYDEGTVHRHCWNMERRPGPEAFETLQGFVPQKIAKSVK